MDDGPRFGTCPGVPATMIDSPPKSTYTHPFTRFHTPVAVPPVCYAYTRLLWLVSPQSRLLLDPEIIFLDCCPLRPL